MPRRTTPFSMDMSGPSHFAHRVRQWFATEQGRAWSRRLRVLAMLGVIVFLIVQLAQIGLDQVLSSLPSTPWFYVVVAAAWAALPASEVLIYRPFWHTGVGATFAVCARKRAFNDDLVGYSGEALIALWGAGQGIDARTALRTVRDNNIVSAAVSMAATLAGAGAALAVGAVGSRESMRLAGLVAIPVAVFVAALALFGRHLFAMSAREASRVAVIHLGRLVLTSGLSMLAWSLAVPTVGWRTWVAFVAMQLLVSRVPLLPGRDFLFVGAGVELASALTVAAAEVAGALLVQVVFYKVLNVLSLILFGLRGPDDQVVAVTALDDETSSSSTAT